MSDPTAIPIDQGTAILDAAEAGMEDGTDVPLGSFLVQLRASIARMKRRDATAQLTALLEHYERLGRIEAARNL